jgi:hypothetical protein
VLAVAPPEVNEQDLERALRRGRQTKLILLAAVIVAVAAYPFVRIFSRWHTVNRHNDEAREAEQREAAAREAYANRPLTADEHARLTNIAPKLHDTVASFQTEWQTATTPDALADVGTLLRACPIAVKSPSFEVGDRYVKNIAGRFDGSILEFTRVQRGEAIPAPDFAKMLGDADAIAKRIAGGSATRKDFEAASALYAPEQPVEFLVTLEDMKAIPGGDTYTPGHVMGTAYIYDLALGAVVCAGKIEVDSSPGINFEFLTRGDMPEVDATLAEGKALERDLEVRTQRAIAKALRATTDAR